MKMSQVLEFLNIYPQIKDNKIKIQTAYKLSKCFDFCTKESEFYKNKLQEIFDEYGQKDETGKLKYDEANNTLLIDTARRDECEAEIQNLLNLEIVFNEQLQISISELGDFELDMTTFQKIKPFIKD